MGQVYGLHLLAGGAEVTYFVRERYVDELRAGTTLHALPRGGSRKLVPTHVRADMAGLAEGFDQVWLCVPTNALTSGALDTVLAAVARAERSSLVCMLPGMQVRALLDQHVPRARVVDGMIGMIAYEAPLPGEQLAPGTAYVLPRLSPSKFSGNEPARVRAVGGRRDIVPGEQRQRDVGDLHSLISQTRRSVPYGSMSRWQTVSKIIVARMPPE